MNEIASICKAVAVAAVASGVISALLPKSRLTYSVNTLSAIIILYAFIVPYSDIAVDFKITADVISTVNISDVENANKELLTDLAEKELEAVIQNILNEKGIECSCEVNLIYKENEKIKETVMINGELKKSDKAIIRTLIETELERSVDIEFTQ